MTEGHSRVRSVSIYPRFSVEKLIEDRVLIVGDGYRAKNSELGGMGLPFARAGNINDGFHFGEVDRFPESGLSRVGTKVSQPGDVVFTSKGTVGRFAFVGPRTERFVYSPQLCFWRSLDPSVIEPRYLFSWMSSSEFFEQFKSVSGQTDMAEYVSLTDQRRMHITLPPLPEQKAIASVLGALDDKIELNRRMNETLEAMAQALFKSWFVDFDPVRAKTEGRRPEGMDEPLSSLFCDSLVMTEFGPIPSDWKVGTVSHLASLERESVNPAEFPEEVFDHFSLPAFDEGRRPKAELGQSIKSNKFAVPVNSVLISKLNPHIPRIWLPELRQGIRAVCSTEFQVLVSRSSTSPEYLFSLLVDETFSRTYNALVTGTTGSHQRVRSENMLNLTWVIPTDPILKIFTQLVAPLFQQVKQNQSQSRTLASLRDTLLPKLLSGELRIKDAESFVGKTL